MQKHFHQYREKLANVRVLFKLFNKAPNYSVIIFNAKVRALGSVIRILSIMPLYWHIIFDADSEIPYRDWVNKHTYYSFLGPIITIAMILISNALQAYTISTLPILIVTISAFFEFIVGSIFLSFWANFSLTVVLSFLMIFAWKVISSTKVFEDKISRKVLDKLEEQERKKNEG